MRFIAVYKDGIKPVLQAKKSRVVDGSGRIELEKAAKEINLV